MMHEPQLEDVLADERGAAAVLRARGHPRDADLIEGVCERVARAAEPYLTWLSETDAKLRSGKSSDWLRSRFALWSSQGLARWSPMNKRARQYRELIVPVRPHLDAVRARARRAANEESAA